MGFVAGLVAGRRGVRTGGGVVDSEKLITRRPLVLAARCPQLGQVARPAGMVAPHLLQKRAGEVLRRAAGTFGGCSDAGAFRVADAVFCRRAGIGGGVSSSSSSSFEMGIWNVVRHFGHTTVPPCRRISSADTSLLRPHFGQ